MPAPFFTRTLLPGALYVQRVFLKALLFIRQIWRRQLWSAMLFQILR